MRINEFADREKPPPSVGKWVRRALTMIAVLLAALSAVALVICIGCWPIWSYGAWGGALIGSILFLVARWKGQSYSLRFLNTAAWGFALISIGLYLMAAESWHIVMVLAWLIPTMGLLYYLMLGGFDVDAWLYGKGAQSVQYQALGDPQRRVDPLQNASERDVPVEHRR